MNNNNFDELKKYTKLSVSEASFLKKNSQTGEERIGILLRQILDDTPIAFRNSKEQNYLSIVDREKSAEIIEVLRSGNKPEIKAHCGGSSHTRLKLYTTDGGEFYLAHLLKTEEFGGMSKGAGSGSRLTNAQEVAQCVAVVVGAEIFRLQREEDLLRITIPEITQFLDSGRLSIPSLRKEEFALEVLEIYKDVKWARSCVNTTNILLNAYPEIRGRDMIIHFDDKFCKNLYNVYKEVNDKEGHYFFKRDKWNPFDFCISRRGSGRVGNYESFKEFNTDLRSRMFDDELYLISLKFVPKMANLKCENCGSPKEFNGPKIEWSDLKVEKKVGSLTTAFTSIPYFEEKDNGTKQYRFEFRTHGHGSISAEICGRSARHGKAGIGFINRLFAEYDIGPLTTPKALNEKLHQGKKEFILELLANVALVGEGIEETGSVEKMMDLPDNKLISKYQAVEVLLKMSTLDDKEQREVVLKLVEYASSRSPHSGPYIKVD